MLGAWVSRACGGTEILVSVLPLGGISGGIPGRSGIWRLGIGTVRLSKDDFGLGFWGRCNISVLEAGFFSYPLLTRHLAREERAMYNVVRLHFGVRHRGPLTDDPNDVPTPPPSQYGRWLHPYNPG